MKNLFLHTFAVIACLTTNVVTSDIHVSDIWYVSHFCQIERDIYGIPRIRASLDHSSKGSSCS